MKKKINDFMEREKIDRIVLMTALVAALGYMVDIFDLLLFSIVRTESLRDLGLSPEEVLSKGILLINVQMAGLIVGGLLWGILGDKRGRLSVLLGSILLYSVANLANGFVQSVEQYAVLRFIAGIGLAGELGAGVTLVSELLPRHLRGIGTTFIASIGMIGAVLAAVVAETVGWRTAYMIGGVMGLGLLALRINIRESGMYKKLDALKREGGGHIASGNIMLIIGDRARLKRYIAVVLIGAPTWAVVGLFITFTPEFAKAFGMTDLPTAGTAVLSCYTGLLIGDLFSGLLSQKLRSRRKAVGVFLGMTFVFSILYTVFPYSGPTSYYFMCLLLGCGVGYWAMFVQMGAEQFGTNIRATAATSIPNMVRGLTIPMTLGFHALIPGMGTVGAGITVMMVVLAVAVAALLSLKETFDTDLDFIEN